MTIFSSSFQNWRSFSFSSQSLSKANPFLFSKVHNILFDFYFSSRNWENWLQISRSPFKIGEIVFKSLFLFSWLFCLSLTTGAGSTQQCWFHYWNISNGQTISMPKGKRHFPILTHCHTVILPYFLNCKATHTMNAAHATIVIKRWIFLLPRMSWLVLLSHVSSIPHIYL